ncbi:FAD-dependent oxidoreductase [Streptomyces apocyni]|uniref:FAD-dependent oxidoreductase n=1 Tax=Streptomyces apocyni TaxID=2654677 RepID=UPI0012EA7F54|nr:FAD-dependent oxidoreductase [Streptomyces apocyni]
MRTDVIVVGGGVIGLTTAVVLAERGVRVRLWTRDEAEDTTSAVAGGLCWPYRSEPRELVEGWAVRSLRVYEALANDSATTGVRLVPGTMADTPLSAFPHWSAQLPGLREARPDELPEGFGQGLRATVPLLDMPVYLRYLHGRLARAGARVERRTVADLREPAAEAGVVVNCAGLGARELVPDRAVRPVRGQLVLVENPGIDAWFVATESPTESPATPPAKSSTETTYVLPQPYGVVLGGTAHDDAWDLTPDPATAEAIVKRCSRVHPALAGARVIGHRVGLRPVRDAVRIERERTEGGGLLVHHYGHGGAGVTVAWGCAQAAADLVS